VESELRMATLDAVVPSWRPGPLRQTGNPLDIAIEGDGLLTVQSSEGTRYVRGGTMTTDAEGTLMTSSGNPLLDTQGQTISIPEDANVSISEDGRILASRPDEEGEQQEVAQLGMVWFDSPALLSREGSGLFSAAAGAEPNRVDASIRSGFIEQSNVNVVRGMIDMVTLTRSYEATIRAMETFRSIDRRTTKDLAHG